ncbi:hypothetical protein Tco_0282467, partial [Tanacetum coccineum]
MFWHCARDDFMFTTIRVISKHHDTQVYVAILPRHLTNQAMLESEAYMTYHAYSTGEKIPKLKSTKKKADSESSPKTKLTQASKGKRIKTIAKGDKPAKKKQSATKSKGLTVLSEVALTEAEQIKLATKKSLIQTHSSHANGSGAYEGTSSIPRVPDVPTYESDEDQISWKSSEEDDDDEVHVSEDDDDNNEDDDVNDDDGNNDDDDDDDVDNQDAEYQNDDDEQTDSDNDGDDFVHPKFSTHDEEDKEEDSFDPRVQTPSHVESTNDEDNDEEIQDANVEGDKMNEEETNEEAEVDALYRDVNVNMEGRDTEMTNAPRTIVQTTQVIEDTHVIITSVNPEGQQQSSSILKTLENNFLEFNQTNQFAAAVSSIPGIVDAYLANKMHEAVKTNVQLQSERLRDEAQAENADFLNKLDDNIKKIIKEHVKEQVKA